MRVVVNPDALPSPGGMVLSEVDAIFQARYSEDRKKTFFHSSSYTANPIACAAALANVEIWRDEPVAERVAALIEMQAAGLDAFGEIHISPTAERPYNRGTRSAHWHPPAIWPRSDRNCALFSLRGLLVRPLGNFSRLIASPATS